MAMSALVSWKVVKHTAYYINVHEMCNGAAAWLVPDTETAVRKKEQPCKQSTFGPRGRPL